MSHNVLQGRCSLFNSHARHAVFFPIPQNCEVPSHPVKAWKNGGARDLDPPREEQIPLKLIAKKWRPLPIATDNLDGCRLEDHEAFQTRSPQPWCQLF